MGGRVLGSHKIGSGRLWDACQGREREPNHKNEFSR
jgi:hypothetical protein